MGIMNGYEPKKVLEFFEQICAVPHGSGNTKAISDYLVRFAEERGLRYTQDAENDVIIVKEASEGYENAETVILQGHIDMVCEKTADSQHDFKKDGLKLRFDGEWLSAENTTLGGDNGIAVAMMMAVLDDDTASHPRIEAVFTSDEEVGLDGAKAVDMSGLLGRRLINLDSEEEGVVTVSCAGGARAQCVLPVRTENAAGVISKISVGGLLGGHSGVDINLGRASANRLMGRVLLAISKKTPVRIVRIKGGSFENVISGFAEAEILTDADICGIVADFDAIIKNEYKTTDPNAFIKAEKTDKTDAVAVTAEDTGKIIYMLTVAPQGVEAMSPDIEGLVQTSLNMGVIGLKNNEMEMTYSVRSSVSSQKYMLLDRLTLLMENLGGEAKIYNEYPAWEFNKDSALRQLITETYKDLFGKEMTVAATHGGLECGIFCGKVQGLDCVSVGPEMQDVHSVKERLNIPSVQRTWEYLLEVLKRMK